MENRDKTDKIIKLFPELTMAFGITASTDKHPKWKEHVNRNKKVKYKKYIFSHKWKKKRNKILKRNPFCYCCGCKSNTVHHTSYRSLGKEAKTDLVSLCWNCHNEVHNLELNNDVKLKEAYDIYKGLLALG